MSLHPTVERKLWEHEPDRFEWIDVETGARCLVLHGPFVSPCGYVEVPPDHPGHELCYDDEFWDGIDVHGGLTFSGVPRGVSWQGIGFDCGHYGDYAPGAALSVGSAEYRTLWYAVAETTKLAKQIASRGLIR